MYQLLSTLALAATVHGVAHNIAVGRGGALLFDPADVTAAVGDTLVFHFYDASGPHDVVSGDFNNACKPKSGAFFSGLMEGDSKGTAGFVVDVTSTDPFYFYCSVNRHCQSGMVGSVNAPSGQGATAYLANARKATSAEAPNAVTGGTTTSIDDSAAIGTTMGSMTSTGTSMGTTTGTGTSTSATASAQTTGSSTGSASTKSTTTSMNAASSAASSLSNAASSVARTSSTSTPTASTTPNMAGGHSHGVVLGVVAAVLVGFVALMA